VASQHSFYAAKVFYVETQPSHDLPSFTAHNCVCWLVQLGDTV